MPKQSYALEAGGEKRLEVSWKPFWKDITVSLDGHPIGTIADQKALSAGQEFRLPDTSTIQVQLVRKFSTVELQVLRNGQPLPGSASDPQTRFKYAYGMVYFVAGLNIVLGLISFLFNVEFLQQIGSGLGSIFFGLVFLVLGFFTQRRSRVALILASAIFALDGLAALFLGAAQGSSAGLSGGLVARIFLLIPMVQGVGAIKTLNQKSA